MATGGLSCDAFEEVACAGNPSEAWVNPYLIGPSLPPAGAVASLRLFSPPPIYTFVLLSSICLFYCFRRLSWAVGWCAHSASTSMRHDESNGMLYLHNFNEDFALALDDTEAECAGVFQVTPPDSSPSIALKYHHSLLPLSYIHDDMLAFS
jgi:hypothetical protein